MEADTVLVIWSHAFTDKALVVWFLFVCSDTKGAVLSCVRAEAENVSCWAMDEGFANVRSDAMDVLA